MIKIVLYLNDEEQKKLEIVSGLMARDSRKQAYVILMNGLNDYLSSAIDDPSKELAEIRARLVKLGGVRL